MGRFALVAGVACVLTGAVAPQADAQKPDTAAAHVRSVRFSGVVRSILTTRAVAQADVRLMYIDSVHTEKDAKAEGGDVFVDSTRSRIGVTDTAGTFTIRNVDVGVYLVQVRRLGFAPFEGVMRLDTLPMEMELALTQVDAVLPTINITASSTNKVIERLDRVGFLNRSHSGFSGTFIDRAEILRRKPVHVTDILEQYGVHSDAIVTIDRMEVDWETLRDYPAELVIGLEIYRRRNTMPAEFGRTRRGGLALGPGASGGISPPTVLIWTFIP